MKELTLEVNIEHFSVQEYYKTIYSDANGFKRFHKELTKDPSAQVSAWDNGVRTVSFQMGLNVPQMIKKMIGAESISVVETQRLSWQGKDKFSVSSEPSLNFPGSNKFTTKGDITVAPGPGGSCQVTCVMSCNAAMPWPMQSTVEAAMATEAQSSIGNFLEFCKQLCAEARAARAAAPAHGPVTVSVLEDAEGDLFYDAFESEQDALYNNAAGGSGLSTSGGMVMSSARSRRASQTGALVPATPENLMVAVQALQASSLETAHAVQQMTEQLRLMNDNIAAIRAVVAPARGGSGAAALQAAGASRYLPPSWVLLALATGSAAAVVYVRAKQRGGGGPAWW